MTLGDFAAFNSYLSLLIFPIILIGFMSNVIAQATASYQRLHAVLEMPVAADEGRIKEPIKGNVSVHDVSVIYGQKPVLKRIEFSVEKGSTLAVIGPTAAESQLLYLLTGLTKPNQGPLNTTEKYRRVQ